MCVTLDNNPKALRQKILSLFSCELETFCRVFRPKTSLPWRELQAWFQCFPVAILIRMFSVYHVFPKDVGFSFNSAHETKNNFRHILTGIIIHLPQYIYSH